MIPKKLGANKFVIGSGKADDRNSSKKLKNIKSGIQTRIGTMGEPIILTPSAKEDFNQLKQTFTKAPIFWYLDLEYHIWIETNALSYAIGRILS